MMLSTAGILTYASTHPGWHGVSSDPQTQIALNELARSGDLDIERETASEESLIRRFRRRGT